MGIRYYAWPLSASDVVAAREDPESFTADDPFCEAWFTANEGNCYLDKAWHGLQLVLALSHNEEEDRPAEALVAGRVTFVETGWIPHVGVLDPDELRLAAADLALVQIDVPEPARSRRRSAPPQLIPGNNLTDLDYLQHNLDELKSFTAALVAQGKGMVYLIG